MRSRTKAYVVLLAFLLVSSLGAYGWSVSKGSDQAREDLAPLLRLSKTLDYTALIGAVKAKPAPGGTFSFVVLGDSRSNAPAAGRVFSSAAGENPAFILHTGDLVEQGRVDEFVNYHLPLIRLAAPVPVIPVPGNHEEGPQQDFAAFRALYGADRFSFDYSECRFVGINNGAEDGLSDDDLKFIEKELSRPGSKHKFVMAHIPPAFVEQEFSKGKTELRGFTANAGAFHDLVRRKGVEDVFLGHDHGYSSGVIDGVRYTITGGAGAKLYESLAWMGLFHHYVIVHVEDGSLRRELVRMDGDKWVRTEIK